MNSVDRPVAGAERFAQAVERVGMLPAIAAIRTQVLDLCGDAQGDEQTIVHAIEADASITLAVLRRANNGAGGGDGQVGAVAEAVSLLNREGVRSVVSQIGAYDPLAGSGAPAKLDGYRRHGVAVRHAAEMIAVATGVEQRAELASAALLHDMGKLVVAMVHGATDDPRSAPPRERARAERESWGADHAVIGGVLARRWRLPSLVATAIERHHHESDSGLGGVVGLADSIVHQASGNPVDPAQMHEAAAKLGLEARDVSDLVAEFPHRDLPPRKAAGCPLSARELDALRGLAEGKVYKQIAIDLGVSVSTVRTHLHNVYRKLGTPDRAQAVLVARERGWV